MVSLNLWNLCILDSYARNALLLLFIFPPFSFAAPIHDSSAPSNWLACLTALLVFSAIFLSASKIIFVRHRKFINLRGPRPVHRQCPFRSTRLFKFSAYTTCKSSGNCKAGFLIGLFGSPSFEVRSKPSELTLIYPGADASGSCQKHDVSGDTTKTHKTNNFTLSTSPVVFFSDKNPCDIHRYNNRPSRFSASLTKSAISRFLPSQLSFDLGRFGRKKGHTKVSTPRECLPWPHNHLEHTTLRLVKLYTEPEASLPLYTDPMAIPGIPSLAPITRGFAVAHLNCSYPSPISSLPSLPTSGTDDEGHMLRVSPSDKRTDHPHNNALLMKPGRQSSRRASLSPNLSVIEETCHASVSRLTNEQAGPVSPTRDPMKGPLMIFSAHDNLKRREKLRPSTLRSRWSPSLGPSPLRSMILPDIVEDDYSDFGYTTNNETKDCPMPKQEPLQYHRIGLGLPPVKLSLKKEGIKLQDSNEITPEKSRGSRESMLDFLRELAEETREWDESIVLDEGFRHMIQRSQAILGFTSLENVNIKCSTPEIPPGSDDGKTSPKFVSFWLEDSPSP